MTNPWGNPVRYICHFESGAVLEALEFRALDVKWSKIPLQRLRRDPHRYETL